ncbi:MAG: glutamate synthase subunit beta [Candidatus Omnitrophica bacterium]|nr:glutamate synthase subunit beta [Candidatus Omnitrophota bacterium]
MSKDVKAFLKIKREKSKYRPVCERVKDYKQVALLRSEESAQDQASRCMDCAVPFCHWACPLGNYIPEWNDAVIDEQWEKAFTLLNETNNLPEITGRVCPAPCEYSCVLGINDDAVTICENELNIIEHAYKYGLIKPRPPKSRTGKKIAVVGSGPAGLAAAAQLNKAGHNVIVYEKDKKCGGLLRYGIPDFKLEKTIVDRRIELLKNEGIQFNCQVEVGRDIAGSELINKYDAVIIAIGSRQPRDLAIEGRGLKGIYFAMNFLTQNNRRVSGEDSDSSEFIDVKGKKVVVIGGGDTGSDCVGTANRLGASCVVQIEVLPKPADCRSDDYPWPLYPLLLKTSSSHQEGAERQWAILTKKFIGLQGKLQKLLCVQVEFAIESREERVESRERKCPVMREIPGSEFEIECDVAILAIGFLHPEHKGLINDLKLKLDGRGNISTGPDYMTSQKGVFSAGDAHRGQSLVVHAISEGRRAARAIDEYITGESILPVL